MNLPATIRGDVFALPIHSTVDLITNSSSTLFIMETGKTVDAVKALVTDLGKWWKGQPYDVFENGVLSNQALLVNPGWNPPPEALGVFDILSLRNMRNTRVSGEKKEVDSDMTELESFCIDFNSVYEMLSEVNKFIACFHSNEAKPNRAEHIKKRLLEGWHEEFIAKVVDLGSETPTWLTGMDQFLDSLYAYLLQLQKPLRDYLESWLNEKLPKEAFSEKQLFWMIYDFLDYQVKENLLYVTPEFREWARANPHRSHHSYEFPERNQRGLIDVLQKALFPEMGDIEEGDHNSRPAHGFIHAFVNGWSRKSMNYQVVVLVSEEDNSVPYGLTETIRDITPIRTWHLG